MILIRNNGLNFNRILQGLNILSQQARGESRTIELVSDYGVANVSEKVIRIILSYQDYIGREVWKKKLPKINAEN